MWQAYEEYRVPEERRGGNYEAYTHYLHGLLSEKERKKKKEGEHLPFDLIKINEPRVFF